VVRQSPVRAIIAASHKARAVQPLSCVNTRQAELRHPASS
jgi:hypothetical protein